MQGLHILTKLADQVQNEIQNFDIVMERTKGHKPDVSTEQASIENQRAILVRLQMRHKNILFAKARAEQDLYGICIQCDESIPAKRLEIIPETCICIDCIK